MVRVALRLVLWFALVLAVCVQQTSALYFYFEAGESKCFYEELPVDTIVVAHYMTEEWDDTNHQYEMPVDINISFLVTHQPTNHVLVSSRATPEGKLAFSSHDPGRHEICIMTEYTGKRVQSGHTPMIRMHLDVIIGDAHRSTSAADRSHAIDILARARELNANMRDLRKEQQYQRERESAFRDLSEKTNSNAAWWSVFQIVALVVTCVWQLTTLRVHLL
ncbi:emp24p/erv25p- protein [Malassezia cuniculi]|uniref:Emp24p/erv25p- protein n=1 Tax=Malassezia cuniculi TaxID=948313 RepID=A0AAF0J7M4_9BASI|nr:emp24p/erv25p- protein [Malassezia cuniculi]